MGALQRSAHSGGRKIACSRIGVLSVRQYFAENSVITAALVMIRPAVARPQKQLLLSYLAQTRPFDSGRRLVQQFLKLCCQPVPPAAASPPARRSDHPA